jgi:hypothetical protein
LLRNAGPVHDPWNEDLFYRHLPVPPPVLGHDQDDPTAGGSAEAMRTDPHPNRLPDEGGSPEPFEEKRVVRPASPTARIVAGFLALAGVLVTMLRTPSPSRSLSRETEEPDDLVPTKATREGE